MAEGYIEEQVVKDEIIRLVEMQNDNLRLYTSIIKKPEAMFDDIDKAHIECIKARRAIGVLQYLYEKLFHEELL